jgi:hypothetical protein
LGTAACTAVYEDSEEVVLKHFLNHVVAKTEFFKLKPVRIQTVNVSPAEGRPYVFHQ